MIALLASLKKFQAGGIIRGEPGPDRVPIWATAGEYVVNARATAQHRELLDAINYGRTSRGSSAFPLFQAGGIVPRATSIMGGITNIFNITAERLDEEFVRSRLMPMLREEALKGW